MFCIRKGWFSAIVWPHSLIFYGSKIVSRTIIQIKWEKKIFNTFPVFVVWFSVKEAKESDKSAVIFKEKSRENTQEKMKTYSEYSSILNSTVNWSPYWNTLLPQ